jgi:hypothetical protein
VSFGGAPRLQQTTPNIAESAGAAAAGLPAAGRSRNRGSKRPAAEQVSTKHAALCMQVCLHFAVTVTIRSGSGKACVQNRFSQDIAL